MEYKQPGLPRKVLHKLRETCYTAFGNAFTKPDPKLIVFSSEPDFPTTAGFCLSICRIMALRNPTNLSGW